MNLKCTSKFIYPFIILVCLCGYVADLLTKEAKALQIICCSIFLCIIIHGNINKHAHAKNSNKQRGFSESRIILPPTAPVLQFLSSYQFLVLAPGHILYV